MAGEARRRRLRALIATAGGADGDAAAYEAAFVHESAVRERLAERSNERLEFFGDSVLGFIVARSLFERYPDAAEGELALRKASLVSDAVLARSAQRLGFDELLLLGGGLAKESPSRRRSALADAFEAFVAVLFRQAGLEAAAAFVMREHVVEVEKLGASLDDPKTVLQEWLQRRRAALPAYVDRFEGPDHERTFFAEVTVENVTGSGSGASKREAQRAAAADAIAQLARQYDDFGPRTYSEPRAVSVKPPKKRGRRAGTPKRTAAKRTHS